MADGYLRAPDVSFVSARRYRLGWKEEDGFLDGAPYPAVEVLSPSDSVHKTGAKAEEYFRNGAKALWIVDPAARAILLCHPGVPDHMLFVEDDLQDESVLPGFSCPVRELFEEPPV